MKKIIIVGMIFGVVFLSACGKKELQASVKEIYEAIENQVTIEPMYESDAEDIFNYYGIEDSLAKEFVFYEAQDGLKVETIAMFQANGEEAIVEIEDGLKNVLEQKKNKMDNYIPEEYAIAEKGVVKTQDDLVYLVISENKDEIINTIESYFK